jgi:hypothetical protein
VDDCCGSATIVANVKNKKTADNVDFTKKLSVETFLNQALVPLMILENERQVDRGSCEVSEKDAERRTLALQLEAVIGIFGKACDKGGKANKVGNAFTPLLKPLRWCLGHWLFVAVRTVSK